MKRHIPLIIAASITAAGLVACGGGSGSGGSSAPVITKINITPNNTNFDIPQGASQQFTATAVYSNGSTQNVTNQVTWSTELGDTGSFSNVTPGLYTAGNNDGAITITATESTTQISATDTFGIINPTLNSISISPTTINGLPVGDTQQLVVTAHYSNGTSFNATANSVWSSNTPVVATVTNLGLVAAESAGSSVITATFGGQTATLNASISSKVLESIKVVCLDTESGMVATQVPNYIQVRCNAIGTYSDSSIADITNSVAWAANNGGVTSGQPVGMVYTPNAGTVTVTASTPNVSGNTSYQSVAVAPTNVILSPVINGYESVPKNSNDQLVLTASYGNKTYDITDNPNVAYSVDQYANGTISQSALYHAINPSPYPVHVYAGFSNFTPAILVLHNTTAEIISIAISVSSQESNINPKVTNGIQLIATGTFTDLTTADVTTNPDVTWSTNSGSYVTVGQLTGIANFVNVGTNNIQATCTNCGSDGMQTINSPNYSVTTTDAVVSSIALTVNGLSGTVYSTQIMGTLPVVATITCTDGTSSCSNSTPSNITSSNTTAATIAAPASINTSTTLLTNASTNIVANAGGVNSNTVTLNLSPVTGLTSNPNSQTIAASNTYQVGGITATLANGQTLSNVPTSKFTWATFNPAVATVSNASPSWGLITAVGNDGESTTISFTANNPGSDPDIVGLFQMLIGG